MMVIWIRVQVVEMDGTGSGDGWNRRIPDIFLNSSDRTW